jgi:putative transposase
MLSDTLPAAGAQKPHSHRLRLWRADFAGCTYFITCCTHHREPLLARGDVVQILYDTLSFSDEQGWVLVLGYAIMPDHWHVAWKLGRTKSLAQVMEAVKKWSARESNILLERIGAVWQPQYYEHLIRSQGELEDCLNYMAMNPVRRGLAERPGEYRWCSVDGLGRDTQ